MGITNTLFQVIRYRKNSANDECFNSEEEAIKAGREHGLVREAQFGENVFYGKLLYEIWKDGKIIGKIVRIRKEQYTKQGWIEMIEKVE